MTVAVRDGWGGGGWGDSPWGSGDVELSLLRAVAIKENVVRFFFSAPPVLNFLGTTFDGGDPSHYQVIAVSGVGLDGEPVRPVLTVEVAESDDPDALGTEIDVTVDRPMTAYPAIYRAVANNLVTAGGSFLTPGFLAEFPGLRAGIAPLVAGENIASSDLANPQVPADLVGLAPTGDPSLALGTYQVAPSGDYAADSPISSYRKRVLRRMMTIPGGFAHLPGYGVGVVEDVKRPATAAMRQGRASVAEQQIMLEPETLSVTVTFVANPNGISYYQIRARTSLSPNAVSISAPVSIGQGRV